MVVACHLLDSKSGGPQFELRDREVISRDQLNVKFINSYQRPPPSISAVQVRIKVRNDTPQSIRIGIDTGEKLINKVSLAPPAYALPAHQPLEAIIKSPPSTTAHSNRSQRLLQTYN